MLINVERLSDISLNYAVAKCKGAEDYWINSDNTVVNIMWDEKFDTPLNKTGYSPCTDWSLGGLIIDENTIEVKKHHVYVAGIWYRDGIGKDELVVKATGTTYLEAGMRCYVKLIAGNEIDIPDDILNVEKY